MAAVTFKVEKNKKYGDYRVVKYVNGMWWNERDGGWSKKEAQQKAKEFEAATTAGFKTMNDTV